MSKTKWYAKPVCHCERSAAILLALALVLSLGIVVLPMASPVAASPGTTYYVNAATGDDGNTGLSPDQAWKTITHAVNTVPAGGSLADPNIIQVAAGTYNNTTNGEIFAITFDNTYVKLSGAGAATTTIDGEGAGTILDINFK